VDRYQARLDILNIYAKYQIFANVGADHTTGGSHRQQDGKDQSCV